MDLIRRMSSGLRSSQDLSTALGQSGSSGGKVDEAATPSSELSSERARDEGEGEGESAADAAGEVTSGLEKRRPEAAEEEEGEGEGERQGERESRDFDAASSGRYSIRAGAPVSDEYDEFDDDDVDDEGEDEDEDEEDGSYGSGESFDSALERMAGSSEAYDTASSPNASSPVGSMPTDHSHAAAAISDSQRGALLRLNEMLTGKASTDTGVIDGSSKEKFLSRVEHLAASKGQSTDDPTYGSIVDALLPLVVGRSGKSRSGASNVDDDARSSGGASRASRGPPDDDETSRSPMPRAKVTAEEDGYDADERGELSEEGGDGDELAQRKSSKIKAVPSDVTDLPRDQDEKAEKPAANGAQREAISPVKVRAPASEPDTDTGDEAPSPAASSGKGSHSREFRGRRQDAGRRESTPEAGDGQERPFAKPSQEKMADGGDEISARAGAEPEKASVHLDDGRLEKGEGEDEDEDEDAEDEVEGVDEEDEDEEEDVLRDLPSAPPPAVGAADSSAGGDAGNAPRLGSAGPNLPARPTRFTRPSSSSRDAARAAQQRPGGDRAAAGAGISRAADDGQANGEAPDGNEETREKLQAIRVKFLRLASRLGQSPHNVLVAQVLYRLGLAEQLKRGRTSSRSASFSIDRASAISEEQEAAGPEELDFYCTIMMLGKTGVGKSATINSIFDEAKTGTNAFSPSTNKVQVITGHVHGIKVRVIDTPGLLPSFADQRHNEKIMSSVRSFIKKQSPDIVLYFDRLDMQSRDYGDLPLLRTITDAFGAAVWFNAIVVLTHSASAPPDGPNGLPISYEMFVAQRSHVVQQTIRQAAGDMRLMNPVSLVENHAACRVNRSGERVLPNGQVWKPHLLLLCFASKILAEANGLLKLQDNIQGKPFGSRPRVPPLPFLLSSLLQSRAQLRLPDEQFGDEDESDDESEEEEESDEDEDYDQLPPFRRLAKEEIAELDEDNRGRYFEELAERERLFQKKQWREELRRRRELRRRMAEAPPTDTSPFVDEGMEEELARSAAVPVPMPDMVLPPSFDSDNPSHRYRYLETANQWLVRPVLETHGWDHDNGYDGMSVEKMFVFRDNIPASVSGQITKDKKEANLNMECAASVKHGEGKSTLAGLDLQTVGKDVGYTLRSETRFSNFKGNKTTGGLALTLLGDTISAGMKIEDRLVVGRRVKVVVNGGAIFGAGDVAYGGSLEATLRDKDYPLSRTLSTLGVSLMDWHGDLAIGGNLQSQFIFGRTMMVGRANLNNRGAGQISIRASSSEQLQMTLIGLLPIIRSIANRLLGSQAQ